MLNSSKQWENQVFSLFWKIQLPQLIFTQFNTVTTIKCDNKGSTKKVRYKERKEEKKKQGDKMNNVIDKNKPDEET